MPIACVKLNPIITVELVIRQLYRQTNLKLSLVLILIDLLNRIIVLSEWVCQKIQLCFWRHLKNFIFVIPWLILHSHELRAADIELPLLGDSTSGIISRSQEYSLGKTWLQAFRSRVDTFDDPLIQDYLEYLTYELATHSDLQDPRLTLIIVNNPTMNAFAVPGGVIGFHTGIFAYAKTEDQMMSIMAHEMAHLSQRHFARGIEANRKSSAISLAGILATLVLSATAGGDAGLAAMTASQALTLDNRLRYSRSNEQEADRIGLNTMVRAGRDPDAVADMFMELLRETRNSSNRAPEFLLTHPISERRVTDTRARTFSNQNRHYPDNPDFYLMQARAMVAMQKKPKAAVKYFEQQLAANTQRQDAASYGLALAQLKDNNYPQAKSVLQRLLTERPNHIPFVYADIEIDIAAQNFNQALNSLEQQLAINPNSFPLRVLQAEAHWGAHSYEQAAIVLGQLSEQRPEDPHIWYKLAEVRGLAGDISGVHRARAEYFILVGALDMARKQLSLAAKLVDADFKQLSIVKQRLRDLAVMQKRLEKL